MSATEELPPSDSSVLILEDDESLANLLGAVLEWTFDRVVMCGDVDRALTEVQQREFDVLVVDIGIGRRSGINFLRAARAAGSTAPAVVTTGLVDAVPDTGIRDLGIEAVLLKPYPLETLEATLGDLVERASEFA